MAIQGHRFLSPKDADQGSPPSRTIKLHLAGCSDEDRVRWRSPTATPA